MRVPLNAIRKNSRCTAHNVRDHRPSPALQSSPARESRRRGSSPSRSPDDRGILSLQTAAIVTAAQSDWPRISSLFSTRNARALKTCATHSLIVDLSGRPSDTDQSPAPLAADTVYCELLRCVQNAVQSHSSGNAQRPAFIENSASASQRHAHDRTTRSIRYRCLQHNRAHRPTLAPSPRRTTPPRPQCVNRSGSTLRLPGPYRTLPQRESNLQSVPASTSLRFLMCRSQRRMRRRFTQHRRRYRPICKNLLPFSCPLPASGTISPGFAARIATSMAQTRRVSFRDECRIRLAHAEQGFS